jgi:hypothetical protein
MLSLYFVVETQLAAFQQAGSEGLFFFVEGLFAKGGGVGRQSLQQ